MMMSQLEAAKPILPEFMAQATFLTKGAEVLPGGVEARVRPY
jgi:hypothetical protein